MASDCDCDKKVSRGQSPGMRGSGVGLPLGMAKGPVLPYRETHHSDEDKTIEFYWGGGGRLLGAGF